MDSRDHGNAQPVPLPGPAVRLIMALSCATALRSVPGKLRTGCQVLLVFAAVFGLMAMAGQLGQIDALTTGGLSFGVLFLGLGLFSAGLSVAREKPSSSRLSTMISSALMLLGGAGVMILLLRPLMFALQMLPLAFGAAACMVFGLGWILLALASRADAKEPAADVVL
jgi:hypothetical protein